jgi:hypothetical protein
MGLYRKAVMCVTCVMCVTTPSSALGQASVFWTTMLWAIPRGPPLPDGRVRPSGNNDYGGCQCDSRAGTVGRKDAGHTPNSLGDNRNGNKLQAM